MSEPSKVVPIKTDGRPKQPQRPGSRAAMQDRPPAMAPVVAPRSAELLREQARLAQVEAEIGILNAEIEGLVARKDELVQVAQAIRAKIVVLEEPDMEPRP